MERNVPEDAPAAPVTAAAKVLGKTPECKCSGIKQRIQTGCCAVNQAGSDRSLEILSEPALFVASLLAFHRKQ